MWWSGSAEMPAQGHVMRQRHGLVDADGMTTALRSGNVSVVEVDYHEGTTKSQLAEQPGSRTDREQKIGSTII